jgi:hypothetical protein
MHIAINDGCSYAVYYVDANGGFATDYGIPTLRAAERIACVRDVQEAAIRLDRAIAALGAR